MRWRFEKFFMIKKLIRIFLGFYLIAITGCVLKAHYSPIIIENHESYKLDKRTLRFDNDNIAIKVKGSASFPSAYTWLSIFEIEVMNKSGNMLAIAYESIGAYYPYHSGKNMKKRIYNKKDNEINTINELFWQIHPNSEEKISVIFVLEEGRSYSDRHHVFTFYINEIKMTNTGEKIKFEGKFKM